MRSFEKVNSGMSGLDNMLDYIRPGDNVVWQVSSLDDYMLFTESLARQAVKDGRNVIYIRFAEHKPVLKDLFGIKVYELNASAGFEHFTVCVHNIITREGKGSIYIFDSLSFYEQMSLAAVEHKI